jgi:hypothetical protein
VGSVEEVSMIRVFFASLVIAVVIGWIFGSSAAIVPIFIVLFVLVALNNVGKLKCPHCGKRVKLGADVCHHCGRDVKSYAMKLAEMRHTGHPTPVQTVLPPPQRASTGQPLRQAEANRLSPPANFCCSCGAALHSGARFCSSCGVCVQEISLVSSSAGSGSGESPVFSEAPQKGSEMQVKCGICDYLNPSDARLCINCGKMFTPRDGSRSEEPKVPAGVAK